MIQKLIFEDIGFLFLNKEFQVHDLGFELQDLSKILKSLSLIQLPENLNK